MGFIKLRFCCAGQPARVLRRCSGITQRTVRQRVIGFEIASFTYWAFGLSDAEASEFLGRNALTPALASCMRSTVWRPSQQKLYCFENILESSVDDAKKLLLVNAVQTYLDLAADEAMSYAELVAISTQGQEIEIMELTWADKIELRGRELGHQQGRLEGIRQGIRQGKSEGIRQGRHDGFRQILELQISERFGPLSKTSLKKLKAIDELDQLKELSKRLLAAESLEELDLA